MVIPPGPKPFTVKGVAGGVYTLVNTLPAWKKLWREMMIQKYLACDTETSGFDYFKRHIVGMSFSWGAANSYYVPVRHTTDDKQLKMEDIIDDLKALFARQDLITIWHNAKFDLHFYLQEGIVFNCLVHDTLILHKLLQEEGSAELKDLAVQEIDPDASKWQKNIDEIRTKLGREKIPAPTPEKPNRKVMRKKANVHYGMIPVRDMVPYAASDAHYTWTLFKRKFLPVANDPDLRQLYLVESQLLWVLLDMEHRGVLIDREYLKKVGPRLEAMAEEYAGKVREAFGKPNLNVGSTAELIAALNEKGITWSKKTKKAQKTALDAEVLERLAVKYEVCEDIVACRKSVKLKSTYVDNLITKLDLQNYLHCSYNQNVVTGRMSSSGPNLQNIPGKTDLIRNAFIVPADFVMVLIDYSQVEVRLTAHYSQDPVLVDAYTKPPLRDVHTSTMCEVFGYDYQESLGILKDEDHPMHHELNLMRKVAKITNFLVIYGGGAENLRVQISTPRKQFTKIQCKSFISRYFAKLRVLQRWIGRTKRLVQQDHHVQNHFGRYRRFPILAKADRLRYDLKWMIDRACRQAVNFLIQGTAADLFKIAMVRVSDLLKRHKAKSRLIMTIHDEIILYMHKDEISLLGPIKKVMEDWDFSVPIVADICYATDRWGNKKELQLAA